MNAKRKKLIITLSVAILLVIVVMIGTSYAYLYTTIRGERQYALTVKGFNLTIDETSTSENILLQNSMPVTDDVGKTTNAYTFSIKNNDTNSTGYIIYLDDVEIEDEVNRMKDTNVKYQLIEGDKETVSLVSDLGVSPFRILSYGIIDSGITNNYSLRFWIKEDAEVFSSQIFSVKIRIIATSQEVIESGNLTPGETIITTDNGITTMTEEQLESYIQKYADSTAQSQLISDRFDKTKNYTIGDYVIYNNTLYRFIADKVAGEWDSSVIESTNIGTELNDKSDANISKWKLIGTERGDYPFTDYDELLFVIQQSTAGYLTINVPVIELTDENKVFRTGFYTGSTHNAMGYVTLTRTAWVSSSYALNGSVTSEYTVNVYAK